MLGEQPLRRLARRLSSEAAAHRFAQRDYDHIGDAAVVNARKIAGELVGFMVADVKGHI